jgi:hypothetical protein
VSLDHFELLLTRVSGGVGGVACVNIAGICRVLASDGVELLCMFVRSDRCVLMVYAMHMVGTTFCCRFQSQLC